MEPRDKDRFTGHYLKYSMIGFELAGSVVIFTLIGYFIDRTWHSTPVATLVGALVGIATGMYLMIKEALQANRQMTRDKDNESKESPDRDKF